MAATLELDALLPDLVEARRDIHRHPELGFEEARTQAKVRAWLEARGLEPCPSAGTGLVVDVRGTEPGRTVALRADLDCLPMDEKTPLPWRSIHPGRAHKCGHDGHTAILMGVADVLARSRDFPGTVRLVFQPAEEGVRGGGARVMIDEGVLEGVDEIYGLHNWPLFPKGEVRVASGPVMAQVTNFDVQVTGVGGHASQPHAARDPIVAAAQIVGALQTVVARRVPYGAQAVISVGTFSAGTVRNVIPSRATLTGTMRTFDPDITELVKREVAQLVRGLGQGLGVEAQVEFDPQYPVLNNDPQCADAVARVATELVGPERVSADQLPITGAEDFAYYTQKIPGAYFFLGAGAPEGGTPGCHHPDFDFEDELIPLGIQMFTGLVRARTGQP